MKIVAVVIAALLLCISCKKADRKPAESDETRFGEELMVRGLVQKSAEYRSAADRKANQTTTEMLSMPRGEKVPEGGETYVRLRMVPNDPNVPPQVMMNVCGLHAAEFPEGATLVVRIRPDKNGSGAVRALGGGLNARRNERCSKLVSVEAFNPNNPQHAYVTDEFGNEVRKEYSSMPVAYSPTMSLEEMQRNYAARYVYGDVLTTPVGGEVIGTKPDGFDGWGKASPVVILNAQQAIGGEILHGSMWLCGTDYGLAKGDKIAFYRPISFDPKLNAKQATAGPKDFGPRACVYPVALSIFNKAPGSPIPTQEVLKDSDHRESAAAPPTENTPSAFLVYNNARFRYSVSYPPELFTALPEADNGDGRRFEPKSGNAEMAVWGSHAANLDDLYRSTSSNAGKVTYSVKRPGWFVVSGFNHDGAIFYQRTIVQDGVARSVLIEYPVAERGRYDAVVPKIAGSLKRTAPPL